MIQLTQVENSPFATTIAEGWRWINATDTVPYVSNELVNVTKAEAEAYQTAANELYELFISAAEHVIEKNLFSDLSIPEALIPLIKYSWQHDEGWHLYGRFDLSGGLNGEPIKLIEFNADTATCLPETTIVQWASLRANGLDETAQFNYIFENLKSAFEELKETHPEKHPSIVFTTLIGYPEDESNTDLLLQAAKEAGFETGFSYIENLHFSKEEGIFTHNKDLDTYTQYDFWFKLIPWEFLAWDEPELVELLDHLIRFDKCVVLNPAYTLLFQSKGMLKVLWDLYPNHTLLLRCSDKPLNTTCVEKVMFGREGANVRIIRDTGTAVNFTSGEYGQQKKVYQEYTPFLTDRAGHSYQAGVFVSGEACGLGFRRGGLIIDNKAQFCGHIIKES